MKALPGHRVLFMAVVRLDAAGLFPNKPIRMLVPFAPAARSDTTAACSRRLCSSALNWQFVSTTARAATASSRTTGGCRRRPPDGYTLLMGAHR
jgi:hypothetical protein